MEIGEHPEFRNQDEEVLPSLFQVIDQVSGFDSAEQNDKLSDQQTGSPFLSPTVKETETPAVHRLAHASSSPPNDISRKQSISSSMPSTPFGHRSPKRVFFTNDMPMTTPSTPHAAKLHSQTMTSNCAPNQVQCASGRSTPQHPTPKAARNPQVDRLKDARFDSFKTWSGNLERQLTRQLTTLRGKTPVEEQRSGQQPRLNVEADALPVHRYYDALQGPELDTLRPSEELMLPEDRRWPFLLRFQVSSFGICLGVSSQAILWKTLATSPSTRFLHIGLIVNLVLWSISVALLLAVTLTYALKLTLYFEAVQREYYHPIRVNFFFAPFITLLFLALGVPPSLTKTLPHALWYALMVPFLCLELKIYGQWMSGGQRRLSRVANPSNHLSVVGNFVGALLGASMGLREGPIFFFAVGMAHYTVLFVTLYQRLPTNETLPKDLHPVFFLFVAAPSVASMAWAKLQGSFNDGSKIAYFIALFLYCSLAVRINFFRGFRFSLAWWAYTFPMTGAAIATINYTNEVTNWVTRALAVALSCVSTLVVTSLLVTTLLHAFVYRRLFPNDIAIAISDRPPRPHSKWGFHHLRHGSSDDNEIEQYLKFMGSGGKEEDDDDDGKDLESSVESCERECSG